MSGQIYISLIGYVFNDMLCRQYGYNRISSGKLELMLQTMAGTLNILHQNLYNFLDNFVML